MPALRFGQGLSFLVFNLQACLRDELLAFSLTARPLNAARRAAQLPLRTTPSRLYAEL